MSLNYIVSKVQDFQGLNGKFQVRIGHIEIGLSEHIGQYVDVHCDILLPHSFEGRAHKERFAIEHPNEIVRSIAINNLNKFCHEIGGLKEGDKPNFEEFIFKICTIFIEKRNGKVGTSNEGKTFSNVIKWQLGEGDFVEDKPNPELWALVEKETGFVMPATPTPSGEILNDEIPF
jgi:hypothetical protein